MITNMALKCYADTPIGFTSKLFGLSLLIFCSGFLAKPLYGDSEGGVEVIRWYSHSHSDTVRFEFVPVETGMFSVLNCIARDESGRAMAATTSVPQLGQGYFNQLASRLDEISVIDCKLTQM